MQLIDLINEIEKTLTFNTVHQFKVNESKKNELLAFIKPHTDIKKIDSKMCNNYIQHLISKGNKLTTIYAKWYYFKGLLTYAYHNKWIDNIPYIKLAKKKQQERTATDKGTILKLLKWCKAHNQQELRKILHIGFYTGLRIDNILHIQSKHINNNYLRVWSNKSDNPYSVPIKKRLQTILNKDFKSFTITYHQARYLFNKAKCDMELDSTLTLHSLRHTFCSRLIEHGTDIRIVQQLAGHKNIQTTQIYTHIKNKTLEQAINLL